MAGEQEGLVLLGSCESPFVQRVRIALAEKKKLPYEYVEEYLLDGKSELLLRSNPVHKKIPVLIHDGRPVSESLIILDYLDEAFPDTPPLLPAGDPYARAQARFWANYIDKEVYECGTRLWKLKGEPQLQARAGMAEILKILDAELSDRAFFGGEALGFVDAAFAPFTAWFPRYEKYGEFSVEEVAPRLAAWARRCGERPSVARSLCSSELIGVLKKKYGVLKKKYGVLKKKYGVE